ncbi:MAG: hypothetical protein N3F09_04295 [Bacteroidia bacterium]|nr:hypothetical protein [Bacteroidia bacterium]
MKKSSVIFFVLLISFSHVIAQKTGKNSKKNYPPTITILLTDIEKLFSTKVNDVVKSGNIFLNQSKVLINQKVVENRQLKLKLKHIKEGYLILQKNNDAPPIIFIISDLENIYYSNNLNGNFSVTDKEITMHRCSKDDIVSE